MYFIFWRSEALVKFIIHNFNHLVAILLMSVQFINMKTSHKHHMCKHTHLMVEFHISLQ